MTRSSEAAVLGRWRLRSPGRRADAWRERDGLPCPGNSLFLGLSPAMDVQPPNFSWVLPGRLAGLALPRLAAHYQFLLDLGVRHLVSLTERGPPHSDSCPDLILHRLSIPDFCPPAPEQIDRFVQIVDEANARGEVSGRGQRKEGAAWRGRGQWGNGRSWKVEVGNTTGLGDRLGGNRGAGRQQVQPGRKAGVGSVVVSGRSKEGPTV